jgi:hypothetical protein
MMQPAQLPSTSSENSKTQIQDMSLVVVVVAIGLRMSFVVVGVAPDGLRLRMRGPLALEESLYTTTMILGTTNLVLVLVVSQLTTMTILETFDLLVARALRLRTTPRIRMSRIQSLVVPLSTVPVDAGKILHPDREANLCSITKTCLTRCLGPVADLIIVEKIEGILVTNHILRAMKRLTHPCPIPRELDLSVIVFTIIRIRTTGVQTDNGHLCPLVSGASNFLRQSLQKDAVTDFRSFQRTNSALLIMIAITHPSSALLTTASTIHGSPDPLRADTTPVSSSPAGMVAITHIHLAPPSPVQNPTIPTNHLDPLSMAMIIPRPTHHLPAPPLTTHAAILRTTPSLSASSPSRAFTPFSAFPAPPRLTRSKPRIAR